MMGESEGTVGEQSVVGDGGGERVQYVNVNVKMEWEDWGEAGACAIESEE